MEINKQEDICPGYAHRTEQACLEKCAILKSRAKDESKEKLEIRKMGEALVLEPASSHNK